MSESNWIPLSDEEIQELRNNIEIQSLHCQYCPYGCRQYQQYQQYQYPPCYQYRQCPYQQITCPYTNGTNGTTDGTLPPSGGGTSLTSVRMLSDDFYEYSHNPYNNSYSYNKPIIQSSATCNVTTKNVGDTITLTSKPSGGTAPYTVYFYKGTTQLGAAVTNVAENQTVTYPYTVLSTDAGTAATFSVKIVDSCTGGSKTVTDTGCPINMLAVPAGGNLLVNPSFESTTTGTWPDKWSHGQIGTSPTGVTATFAYTTVADRTGKVVQSSFPSLPGTDATTGYGIKAYWMQDVIVTPNSAYTLSGWIKTENMTPASATGESGAFLRLDWKDSAGVYIAPSKNTTILKTNTPWTQYSGTFTSPATAGKATIILAFINCVGTATFDDISLVGTAAACTTPAVNLIVQ